MKKIVAMVLMGCILFMFAGAFAEEDTARIEQIEQVVRNALENDDWEYEYDEEVGCFVLPCTMDNALNDIYIVMFASEEDVYIIADSDIYVSDELFGNMAVFVTLANSELYYGKFCIDSSDGWILYNGVIYFGENTVTEDEVLTGIYDAYFSIVDYGTGIAACADGADPYAAFEECIAALETE